MRLKIIRPQFLSFGLSDIGLTRPNNEDVWEALPEVGFFALADGMGGHQAGEVAAKETISHLCNWAKKVTSRDPVELIIDLKCAIEKTNQSIYKMGKSQDALHGMGTTLCCMFWTELGIVYAHVGDSRLYRLRDQKLELLTKDHSLLSKWLDTGELAQKCETPFPYKNVITRAVGTSPKANPEIAFSRPEPNDLYFLCTDGLTDVLSLDDMEKILNRSPDLENACKRLIQKAKIKGSSDNITLLLIKQTEIHASPEDLLRQQRDDGARSESAGSHAGGS
jgi:protein phosphatase